VNVQGSSFEQFFAFLLINQNVDAQLYIHVLKSPSSHDLSYFELFQFFSSNLFHVNAI
jgi:hypothetical protein